MTRSTMLAVAMLALAAPLAAHDYTLGAIEIGHPAARAAPPAARTGAGYLTLTNTGAGEDRLVAASGAIAARIEIHETTVTDGVARMRPLDGLLLPPGQTVALEPGGVHLMLIGLSAPLTEGESVPVTLTFEQAGEIEVELAVETMSPGDDHGHD